MIRVLFDHTCIQALAEGDEFLNGLYVEASSGCAEIVIPTLSATVADATNPAPASTSWAAASPPSPTSPAHTPWWLAHWRQVDWRILHPAASVLVAQRAGDDATLLSLDPDLYAGTGVSPLNPMSP